MASQDLDINTTECVFDFRVWVERRFEQLEQMILDGQQEVIAGQRLLLAGQRRLEELIVSLMDRVSSPKPTVANPDVLPMWPLVSSVPQDTIPIQPFVSSTSDTSVPPIWPLISSSTTIPISTPFIPPPLSNVVISSYPVTTQTPPQIPYQFPNLSKPFASHISNNLHPAMGQIPVVDQIKYPTEGYRYPTQQTGQAVALTPPNWDASPQCIVTTEFQRVIPKDSKAFKKPARQGGLDTQTLIFPSSVTQPAQLGIPEFEKFDGTGCPEAHVRSYLSVMQIMRMNPDTAVANFHSTLAGAAKDWLASLESTEKATWSQVITLFLAQYKGNRDECMGKGKLEDLSLNDEETRSEPSRRHKRKIVGTMNVSDNEEQILLYPKNAPTVQGDQPQTSPYRFSSARGSHRQRVAKDELSSVAAKRKNAISSRFGVSVSPSVHRTESRQAPYPQNPYHCGSKPSYNVHQMVSSSQGSSHRSKGEKRIFDEWHAPLSLVFKGLVNTGRLAPMESFRPSSSRNLDLTKYCEYHRYAGHDTDHCLRLKHEIQNLIDSKVIAHPPPLPTKPSHGHVNILGCEGEASNPIFYSRKSGNDGAPVPIKKKPSKEQPMIPSVLGLPPDQDQPFATLHAHRE